MFVFLAELDVLLLVHECLEVVLASHGDLEQPAVLLGLVIDECGLSLNVLVVCDDLAGDWGVDIGRGLDGLNADDSVALLEDSADLRDVEVDNVSELALSEVGDTDLGFL